MLWGSNTQHQLYLSIDLRNSNSCTNREGKKGEEKGGKGRLRLIKMVIELLITK